MLLINLKYLNTSLAELCCEVLVAMHAYLGSLGAFCISVQNITTVCREQQLTIAGSFQQLLCGPRPVKASWRWKIGHHCLRGLNTRVEAVVVVASNICFPLQLPGPNCLCLVSVAQIGSDFDLSGQDHKQKLGSKNKRNTYSYTALDKTQQI